MSEMKPITLTIEGAKRYTSLGSTKIFELIAEGKLETVKVGRRTLVKTESIDRLLAR